jgi:hypothetical protein
MTGRTTAKSVEGTIVSAADLARAEADQQHAAARQRRAAMVVASSAHDAKDAQLLLSILGLDVAVVDAARQERAGTSAQSTTRKRRARAA